MSFGIGGVVGEVGASIESWVLLDSIRRNSLDLIRVSGTQETNQRTEHKKVLDICWKDA